MHPSRPTVSFFLLVAVAAIASLGALILTTYITPQEVEITSQSPAPANSNEADEAAPVSTDRPKIVEINTDTDTWHAYTDPTYFVSFKHPSDWDVQTFPNSAGYYVITISPKKGSDSIRIYISPDNYSGLAGLPSKKDTIAGVQAINVYDIEFGVKYAAHYYTFDMGTDFRMQPTFKAMLNTVAFSK